MLNNNAENTSPYFTETLAPEAVGHRSFQRLQIILKTAERCNLACQYCYYFFGGDTSYKNRPPVIKEPVYVKLVERLKETVHNSRDLKEIMIAFHGGEPTLQKIDAFETMVKALRSNLDPIIKLNMAIQTNGTLLSKKWVDVCAKYKVGIGVSMDGTKLIHDKYRVDHKGRGSYDKIVSNLAYMRSQSNITMSVLLVINHNYDYKEIFKHMHKDLGFKEFTFLLPDISYEDGTLSQAVVLKLAGIFRDIFDYAAMNSDVTVREVKHILDYFKVSNKMQIRPHYFSLDEKNELQMHNQILVVQSDGEMRVDDSLIPAKAFYKNAATGNIFHQSIKDFLNSSTFHYIDRVHRDICRDCKNCDWFRVCRGGELENRFHPENGFKNPSVFCEVYKLHYKYIVEQLLSGGYDSELLWKKLEPTS